MVPPTPPPATEYVTLGFFEWAVVAFAVVNAAFIEMLRRMFNRHLIEDDARFEKQELRIDNMHLANQKERAEMEVRLSDGQKRIEEKVDKLLFWHMGPSDRHGTLP